VDGGRETIRLDKWLWQARMFRSRSLAARQVAEGRVRVNGARVGKPATPVAAGDTLTFVRTGQVLVLRIVALGARRGPAAEAAGLYTDLSPPDTPSGGGPRPTGRDRRAIDAFRDGSA